MNEPKHMGKRLPRRKPKVAAPEIYVEDLMHAARKLADHAHPDVVMQILTEDYKVEKVNDVPADKRQKLMETFAENLELSVEELQKLVKALRGTADIISIEALQAAYDKVAEAGRYADLGRYVLRRFNVSWTKESGDDLSTIAQDKRQQFIDLCNTVVQVIEADPELNKFLSKTDTEFYFTQGLANGTWTADQLIGYSPELRRRVIREEKMQIERDHANAEGLPLIIKSDDLDITTPKRPWPIEGMIPDGGYVIIYGDPSTYKSYLALDLALTLANEHETWLDGREVCVSGGDVLYVASEGYETLLSRIKAWKDGRNVEKYSPWLKEYPDSFRGVRTTDAMPKVIGNGFDDLVTVMKDISPDWSAVVLDTLRGALGPDIGERSDTAGPAMKAAVDKIRQAFGCPVIVTHHKTKYGNEEAGTNHFRADADAMFDMGVKGNRIELKSVKFRDAPLWRKPLIFTPKQVEGHGNIVLALAKNVAADPELAKIEAALATLEPGTYTLSTAASMIAGGTGISEQRLRKIKLRESKFYQDGKIIIPASEAG